MINQIEPWITNEEAREVLDCVSSTFVTEGKYTQLFEAQIQHLHQTKYQPVAYANATVALYGALKILGIRPGDEVIVPSTTFIATANAVIMAGGLPVTVDVDENFDLDLDELRRAITANTFAVIPVHLYGHFTNVHEIKAVCETKGIYVVEDASQGVGVCSMEGTYAGTVGDIGVLSFYGNKFVTSAQGGMIISDNLTYLHKAQRLKNHGRANKGTFFHEDIGFNFCTSDLHSALGFSQLKRFDEIRERKLEIYNRYDHNLRNNAHVKLDRIISDRPAYWFISIFIANAQSVEEFLAANGVQTRRAFPPLSEQPCYEKFPSIRFGKDSGAKKIFDQYLSLPSKATLTYDEIDFICDKINDFFNREIK